jgi:hypothetical protein
MRERPLLRDMFDAAMAAASRTKLFLRIFLRRPRGARWSSARQGLRLDAARRRSPSAAG